MTSWAGLAAALSVTSAWLPAGTFVLGVGLALLVLRTSVPRPPGAAAAARERAERQFLVAFHGAPIGMALVAINGRFQRVNPALCALLDRSETELLATDFQSLTHPADLAQDVALLQALLDGERSQYSLAKRYRRPDGSDVFAALSVSLVRDDDGAPSHLVSQVEDVTARRAAAAKASAADARFRAAFDDAPVGVALIEPASLRIVRANPALTELIGSEALALGPLAAVHPHDRSVAVAAAQRALAERTPAEAEVRVAADGDRLLDVVLAVARVEDQGGALLIAHVLDVTERKRFERRLRHLADHDPLTGLHNRRSFEDLLADALAHRARYGGSSALLLLDLDGFKDVNDTLGHAAGDGLIIRMGALLSAALRDTDRLARIGGDEFAVLLPEADRVAAEAVADKLLEVVRVDGTVLVDGRRAQVTASIGIALLDGTGSADDALVEADLAMYAVKDAGRDGHHVFDGADGHRERLTSEAGWAQRLREAPHTGRLTVVAQPIVALGEGAQDRFELLLRYVGDDGELIAPGAFLDIAERADLVGDLDRWVLATAARRLHELQDDGRDVTFHVNLSGRTIADPTLADHLSALLAATPVAASSLVVELTETAAISNLRHAQAFTARLHELGCQLALDDFGAGFASFTYLKHLRFDQLKIDGDFVRHLPRSPTDQLVVRALVDVAHGMGITTVAEFVSGDDCVASLRALGVDLGQGYHLGRPEPLERFGLQAPAAA